MTLVVFVPAIVALVVAARRGFRDALVFVALPALLLIPTTYQCKLPGLPVATFFNYTFLVTLAALLLGKDRALLRLSALDALVAGYAALLVTTEYVNKDYAEAQNMAARVLMGTLAPYAFGRAAARHDGLLVGVVAMLVGLGFFIGAVSPYEARFGIDPFDWLRDRWPEPMGFTRAMYRNGLRRVEGPFSQPICQGLYFTMSAPLLYWLCDARLIVRPWLRRALALAFAAGLLLTHSRGPLMGAVLVLVAVRASWSVRRGQLLAATVIAAALALAVSWETIRSSWFVTRAEATTEEQHSAAYRFEMLENYLELVDERPWEGFGRNQIPVVKGQDSIDNQYLFLALSHGLPSSAAYLAVLLGPAAAAAWAATRRRHDDRHARLALAVSVTLTGVALVQVTVYAGTQTEQVLFLLAGLATGLSGRLAGGEGPATPPPSHLRPPPACR